MSKRSQIILRLGVVPALVLAPALGLMGCESLSQAAGINKEPPDEFAVLTKAPLIIPPDYNLRPPSPGAAPINQQAPTQAAESDMFATSDAQTAAQSFSGNYSPGERLLLANAGAQNSDPEIRAELQSDEKSMQGADQSFTDKILFGKPDDTGVAVDADAEANKTQGIQPAKPKDSATIEKNSDGLGSLFDWF